MNNAYHSPTTVKDQLPSGDRDRAYSRMHRYRAAFVGGIVAAPVSAAIAYGLTCVLLVNPISRWLGFGSVFDVFLLVGNPLIAAISVSWVVSPVD